MPQQDDILQGPFTKYLTEPAHQAAPINPSGYMGNTGAVAFIADKFLAGASQSRRRMFEQQEFKRAQNESALNSALAQIEKRTDLVPEVKNRLMAEISRYKLEQVAGSDVGGSGGKKQGGNPLFDFVKGMASNMVGGPVKKAKPIDDAAMGRLFQELENPENTIPFQVETATSKANEAIDSIIGTRQPGFVSLQEVIRDPRFQESVAPFTKYTDGKLPPQLAMKIQSFFPSANPATLAGLMEPRLLGMSAAGRGLNLDGSPRTVEQQLPEGMIGAGMITGAPPNQVSPALMPAVNTAPPPGAPVAASTPPGAPGQPQVDALVNSAMRKQFGVELESVNALIDGKQVRVLRDSSTGMLIDPVSQQPLPPDQQRAATGTTVFNPSASASKIVLEERAGAGGRPERVWVDKSKLDANNMPTVLGKFGDKAVEIDHRVGQDEMGNTILVPITPSFVPPGGRGTSGLPSTTPPPAPAAAKPTRTSPPGTPVNANPWAKARAAKTAQPAAAGQGTPGGTLLRHAATLDDTTREGIADGSYTMEDFGNLGLSGQARNAQVRQLSKQGIQPFKKADVESATILFRVNDLIGKMQQMETLLQTKGPTAAASPQYYTLANEVNSMLGNAARFRGGERSAVLSDRDISRIEGLVAKAQNEILDPEANRRRLREMVSLYKENISRIVGNRSPDQVKKFIQRQRLLDVDSMMPGAAMPPELQNLLKNLPGGAGAAGAR